MKRSWHGLFFIVAVALLCSSCASRRSTPLDPDQLYHRYPQLRLELAAELGQLINETSSASGSYTQSTCTVGFRVGSSAERYVGRTDVTPPVEVVLPTDFHLEGVRVAEGSCRILLLGALGARAGIAFALDLGHDSARTQLLTDVFDARFVSETGALEILRTKVGSEVGREVVAVSPTGTETVLFRAEHPESLLRFVGPLVLEDRGTQFRLFDFDRGAGALLWEGAGFEGACRGGDGVTIAHEGRLTGPHGMVLLPADTRIDGLSCVPEGVVVWGATELVAFAKIFRRGREEVAIDLPIGWSITRSPTISPDSQHLSITATSVGSPERTFDFSLVGRSSWPHAAPYTVELRWFDGSDGVKIPVTLVKPRRSQPHPPILVVAYGAYGRPLASTYRPEFELLLRRGWQILLVHVRGGSDLGTSWAAAGSGIRRQQAWLDLQRVAQDMSQQGTLFGYSWSAGAALFAEVGLMNPGLFSGLILEAPLLGVARNLVRTEPYLRAREAAMWGQDTAGFFDPEDLLPLKQLPPSLVVVNEQDTLISRDELTVLLAKVRPAPLVARRLGATHQHQSSDHAAVDLAVLKLLYLLETSAEVRLH